MCPTIREITGIIPRVNVTIKKLILLERTTTISTYNTNNYYTMGNKPTHYDEEKVRKT